MKYFQYIYIPGLLLLFLGLITGLVSQLWLPIPISLLVLGFCLLGIWLLVYSKLTQLRSVYMGIKRIITGIVLITILGLLNFLVIRYEVRIDFTENQLFTLSPQSQAIVANLNKPLKVWIFQNQINPKDRQLLENYRHQNSQFSFEFVDPEIEVQLAKQFEMTTIGEVYLEYQGKKRLIQTISPLESLSEAKLTSGIQSIQRDRPPTTLYFLQGHGESELNASEGGLSEAVNELEAQAYQAKTLNLATVSKIPEDASGIMIIGPKRELLKGEVEALQEYLENQGRLLLMLDPKTNSGLEPILQDWGIQLDERIVIDVSGSGSLIGFGPATVIVTEYGDHPITQAFDNGISIYPLARPISTKASPEIEALALLITNEQSWAEARLDGEEIEFNPEEDIKGPLDIGVALNRDSSRLVIIGNSTFATNGWFAQQLNRDVFLNTVEWLTGAKDSLLSIRPKQPRNRRINLTVMQANLLSWLALVWVPVSAFIAAGIFWWRRK